MKKDTRMNVKLDDDLHQEIKLAAVASRVEMYALIERVWRLYLKVREANFQENSKKLEILVPDDVFSSTESELESVRGVTPDPWDFWEHIALSNILNSGNETAKAGIRASLIAFRELTHAGDLTKSSHNSEQEPAAAENLRDEIEGLRRNAASLERGTRGPGADRGAPKQRKGPVAG